MTPEASGPRILVVEDNPITRKMVRHALASEGFRVLEAETGGAALAIAREAMPDLILQDMLLDDINGFDLVRAFRNLPGGAATRILAFSGHEPSVEQARAGGGGFDDYLLKPVEPSRLVATVRAHLAARTEVLPDLPDRHILIADDDPMRLKLLRINFEQLHCRVSVATDGEEALAAARREPPDAIISDVLMPGIDGFGLTAAVRRDPALAGIPVILITSAYRAPEDRDLAMQLGAADLLVLDPAHLADGVREAAGILLRQVHPAMPTGDPEQLIKVHRDRLARQLESQMARNDHLSRRLARVEAELAVLGGLSQIGLGRNGDGRALQDMVARALDGAGVSRGLVVLEGHGSGPIVSATVGMDGFPAADLAALLERAAGGSAAATGTLILAAEAGANRHVRELLQAFGAPAVLVCPFVIAGEERGWFAMGSAKRDVDQDWIGFATALGAQIAQTIDFSRTLTDLARSREMFEAVTENIGEVFFMMNAALTETHYISKAYERVWGRTVASLYANAASWGEAVHPDDGPALQRFLATVADGASEIEYRIVRPEGGIRWILARTFPVPDAAGRITRITGIAEDITDRRARQARHQVETALIRLLADAPDLATVAERVVQIIGEHFGWHAGILWRTESAGAPLHCLATWHGPPSDATAAFFEASRNLPPLPGTALPGRATAAGRAVRIPDLSADPGFLRAATAAQAGLLSAIAFPIMENGGALGVLEFFDRVTGTGDEAMLPALEGIGLLIGQYCTRKRTERALASSEERLRQAQKLEAVGQLAGGVAHDFNNMLTPIIGYCDLILPQLEPGARWRPQLEVVRRAADRGAGLVAQLLAFSRRSEHLTTAVDLNTVVRETVAILNRTLGEHIEIDQQLAAGLDPVLADSGQMSQVLMNLSLNARDAMPGGGRLTFTTRNVTVGPGPDEGGGAVAPGRYAVLEVSDTGTGIPPEVLRHMYEPFFTTKEPGKGTGLGLASVYGIVKQAGGSMEVDTAMGRGTLFRIHLPAATRPTVVTAAEGPDPRSLTGTETILLVEDEEMVRALAAAVLGQAGYTILEARHGGDALAVAHAHAGVIDLVLSDLIMPVMGGRELVTRLAGRPGLRTLLVSGYDQDGIPAGQDDVPFLPKPYSPSKLLRKVRQVLDAPVPAGSL